jgi:DNA replication protein DnaC
MARLGAWEASPEGIDFLARAKLAELAEVTEAHAERRRTLLSDARIPERYWFMAVAEPHETEAVKALRQEVAGLVVLSGAPGCGKTAAVSWWLSRAPGSKFITAAKLSRISKWGDEVKELIKATRLGIDDLGVEFADDKGFFVSLLDDVINERYSRQRPTVITTNMQAPLFSSRYKGRIVDRVDEFCGFTSLSGGSLRGSKQLGLLPAADGVHT